MIKPMTFKLLDLHQVVTVLAVCQRLTLVFDVVLHYGGLFEVFVLLATVAADVYDFEFAVGAGFEGDCLALLECSIFVTMSISMLLKDRTSLIS